MKRQRITWLLLTIVSLPIGLMTAFAQNVPTTVREAAESPQFAARPAHPAKPQLGSHVHRRLGACSLQRNRGRLHNSPLDNILYNNGLTNGSSNAFFVDVYRVSDSFSVSPSNNMTSFTFAEWVSASATALTVDWAVGTSSFASDVGSGSATFGSGGSSTTLLCTNGSAFNGGTCGGGFGYDVYNSAVNVGSLALSSGTTYWLTLTNTTDNFGGRDGWDINSGASLAYHNLLGAVPSESFTINGSQPPPINQCMPEHSAGFNVIYDFSGGDDGYVPSGVAIDRSGNLYGPAGGNGQKQTVFKVAQAGSTWSLSTLYNFPGGNNGSHPNGVIVGPKGILYGAAYGGLLGDGLIFGLGPSPTVGRSTWGENTIYDFTSLTDAYDGSGLVSDQAGNLYGVSASGGAQQKGAVFELSPSIYSIGGWTESIVYSFTGGGDGGGPTTVVAGTDGNVYGMAGSGGLNGYGVVFQLTRSGSGWAESVLYNLPNTGIGTAPRYLVQDGEGNLFGIYDYLVSGDDGWKIMSRVFMLTPSNGQWTYSELAHSDETLDQDTYQNLAIDAAGNLYGTGRGGVGCMNAVLYGYVFTLRRGSYGWNYDTPVYWDHTDFWSDGALALDAEGNLYGTTGDCGTNNLGTVWEFTP